MNDSEIESLIKIAKNLRADMEQLQANITDLQNQMHITQNLRADMEQLQANITDLQNQIKSLKNNREDNMSIPKPKKAPKKWLIAFLYALPFISLTLGYILYFSSSDRNKIFRPKVPEEYQSPLRK